MKFAVIAPVPHFHLALKSQIHLLLTPVMKDPEVGRAYTERYRMLDRRIHYKILDNGAHENDRPSSLEDTLHASRTLGCVSEVVMPDVQQDPNATVDAVTAATDWLLTDWGIDCYQHALSPNLMYVPQGRNKQEWVGCLKFLIEQHERLLKSGIFPLNRCIGIAKKHALVPGMTIRECCQWVQRLTSESGTSPVHLLGWPAETSIVDLREEFSFIRSIDSAKPVSLAMDDVDAIRDETWPTSGRPEHFFRRQMTAEQVVLAEKNIERFKHVTEGR